MIKYCNYDYLVPGGLGDVLQDDHSEGLHQRHALGHREGDVDAPARRISICFYVFMSLQSVATLASGKIPAPRLRECCRQVETEMERNSSKKIIQTWVKLQCK